MSNNTARELVLSYLPPSVSEAVRESAGRTSADVSEIRLRSNGACSLTVMGMNRRIDMAVGDFEMREIFRRICGGAVFAHREVAEM